MPHKGKDDAKHSKDRGKVEVKVEVGKAGKPSTPKPKPKPPKGQVKSGAIAKAVAKDIKKTGLEGPRPRQSIRVSATVGFINGSDKEGPVLAISQNLHPALTKEPQGGTAFGPLAAAAAQFGQWRLNSVTVNLTPLVGASAAAGTVVRLSVNTTDGALPVTWGGLGARHHRDVSIGQQCRWNIDRGVLSGPRQTWWLTDTNETGAQSAGPSIEAHVLGQTTSTYQNAAWTKPLFMVELHGRWEFTTYANQPGLGVLERSEASENVTFSKDQTTGALTMSVASTSSVALFMGTSFERSAHIASGARASETVWKIVDVGAKAAASVAPTPFNWVIRGGLWFVKRIFGAASDATVSYTVYESLNNALTNSPIIPDAVTGGTVNAMNLQMSQMNNPNIGPTGSTPGVMSTPTVTPDMCDNFLIVGMARTLYESKTGNTWQNLGNSFFPWSNSSNKTLMQVQKPGESIKRIQLMGGFLFQDAGTGTPTPPVLYGFNSTRFMGQLELSSLRPSGLTVNNKDGRAFGNVLLCKSENFDGSSSALSLTFVFGVITNAQAAEGMNPSDQWTIRCPSNIQPTQSGSPNYDFTKLYVTAVPNVRLEAKAMAVGVYFAFYAYGNFAIGGPGIVPPSVEYPVSTGPESFYCSNPSSENNTLPWDMVIGMSRSRNTELSLRLLKPTLPTDPVDEIVARVLRELHGGCPDSDPDEDGYQESVSDIEVVHSGEVEADYPSPQAQIAASGLTPELAARVMSALWPQGQSPGFSPPN
uniref:Capsid protein n=1 Tax=Rousettus bat astrovirus TaxID=3141900 RepID=A0AAU7E1B5_9VIRU